MGLPTLVICWTDIVEQYCNRAFALLQAVPHEIADIHVKTLVAVCLGVKTLFNFNQGWSQIVCMSFAMHML